MITHHVRGNRTPVMARRARYFDPKIAQLGPLY
jgi:hypothetical protein